VDGKNRHFAVIEVFEFIVFGRPRLARNGNSGSAHILDNTLKKQLHIHQHNIFDYHHV
jgi:hypothetical protein